MTWSYPRARYRWALEPSRRPQRPPTRRYVPTEEGVLAFDVKAAPWREAPRQRLACLNGAPISDDELELRLADLDRLRRSA
jgi:hypothetical protein